MLMRSEVWVERINVSFYMLYNNIKCNLLKNAIL
uniref:Uncharacterized protein n=1 Tax=Rhizophora mucronata TaxID=61149 RepID=A0A2P2N558_RHIMU